MSLNKYKLKFSLAMAIFGTIGIFVRVIPFPSSVICMCRGVFGGIFLIAFILIKKQEFFFKRIKNNLWYLLISGTLIGFNWILLFESYKYTSVAKATLCYYMSPVMIIAVSPFIFKEELTVKKVVAVFVSLLGMLLVSGVLDEGHLEKREIKGIVFGLVSAVLYSAIIISNKKLKDINPYEQTVVQLLVCGFVMLVYSSFTKDILKPEISLKAILFLVAVCIVHTGIAYLLYFGSMDKIKSQNIAILSYIDPVVAVILSSIIEKPMSGYGILGSVLIIGSALTA